MWEDEEPDENEAWQFFTRPDQVRDLLILFCLTRLQTSCLFRYCDSAFTIAMLKSDSRPSVSEYDLGLSVSVSSVPIDPPSIPSITPPYQTSSSLMNTATLQKIPKDCIERGERGVTFQTQATTHCAIRIGPSSGTLPSLTAASPVSPKLMERYRG